MNSVKFSCLNRGHFASLLKSQQYDLLIIGGGITGAGIALDAASRGLKTALIEQSDFASGTSSRSTKLIHGGLRYLKQLEFALVKEVGSERAVVHRLAPHLVIPEKMLLPLREKRGYGSLLTSFGLKLYDWLAGVTGKDRRLMLTRQQTLRREPLLNQDGVKGGALYAEYRTDDARLTIEIIKQAVAHGAHVYSYCPVVNFIYSKGQIAGVHVSDKIGQQTFEVRAKVVVNAAGPWVDGLREKDKSKTGKRLHLTKGIHIVVPHQKFSVRQAIYFDIADGRMIFAIPRGRTTYIGTTDTNYRGSIDGVCAHREDADYLVAGVNETFSRARLTLNDIESSWAGLRPLIHEEGKSASELSRKDEIFESPTGLISIAGGKLTGYRKMAERVVDLVIDNHFSALRKVACTTTKIKLGDGKLTSNIMVKRYIRQITKLIAPMGLDAQMAHYLVGCYGRQTDIILEKMSSLDESDVQLRLLKSELLFTVENEMVCNSLDFFIRRTGRLYFDIHHVIKYKQAIGLELGKLLGWTTAQCKEDEQLMDAAIDEARCFLEE